MTLPAGTRLGPYEILSPLGAGGMGEVYRARDERLKRDVAIKILPSSFSNDSDRLRRFEHEAQAAGSLDHPNITAVHDIGSYEGAPYIVTELLDGETLRTRLAAGALPNRKAIDYAIQIAQGLAAAHEKGIIHRDLKPENVVVTKDGRVKILDFGLAKLTHPEVSLERATSAPTLTVGTEAGVVMGTVGYMSPEQACGQSADPRSDIFAFGAILYEMLSGRRAFARGSAAETTSAILTEDPPDLTATNKTISPSLVLVVRHCLEKDPAERFYSARDLAFALQTSSESQPMAEERAVPSRWRRLRTALAGVGGLAALAASFIIGARLGHQATPSYRRLTFRVGFIESARFTPNRSMVVYTAAWGGRRPEILLSDPGTAESRAFGLADAEVLSISKSGEMAVSIHRKTVEVFIRSGTLARMSVTGEHAPREIQEDVQWADWAPDGEHLAIVRDAGIRNRLEFPIGKVLYETAGWISNPRVSPKGNLVGFVDHPVRPDDGGFVAIVDLAGHKRTLSPLFYSVQGLAWSADGREVWFTAAGDVGSRALRAVTVSGRQRLVTRVPGTLTLQDISGDGHVLMTQDEPRRGMMGLAPGEQKERDLSWLDYTLVNDLSADGRTVAFWESGEGTTLGYSVYVRDTDGSPAVRLGEGALPALSPDGKSVLAVANLTSEPQLILYPIAAGEPRLLSRDGLNVEGVTWLPDGKRAIVSASEAGRGVRLYVRDLAGGKAQAVSPEGYRFFAGGLGGRGVVSPDGRFAAVLGPGQRSYFCPLNGGAPVPIPGVTPQDVPLRWSADGRFLFVFRATEMPARVYRLEVANGRKELWKEVMPADPAGVTDVGPVIPTPSGESYVYSYSRTLSTLFQVEGLK